MKKLLFLFSLVAMLSLAWYGANAGPPDDVGTSQEVVCLSENMQAPVAHFDYAFEASANLVYDSPDDIYIVYAAPPAISQYAYVIDRRYTIPPDNCTKVIYTYTSYLMPFNRPLYWPLHFV